MVERSTTKLIGLSIIRFCIVLQLGLHSQKGRQEAPVTQRSSASAYYYWAQPSKNSSEPITAFRVIYWTNRRNVPINVNKQFTTQPPQCSLMPLSREHQTNLRLVPGQYFYCKWYTSYLHSNCWAALWKRNAQCNKVCNGCSGLFKITDFGTSRTCTCTCKWSIASLIVCCINS